MTSFPRPRGWRAGFAPMTQEGGWGGESFEDAGLVEVVRDENGNWVEAE